MSWRVSTYLALTLAFGVVVVTFANLRLGLGYLFAASAIMASLMGLKVPKRFFFAMLLGAGAIWISHLARPLVLAAEPSLFNYPRLGIPSNQEMFWALLAVGGFGFAMMLGMWLGIRLVNVRSRVSGAPLRGTSRRGWRPGAPPDDHVANGVPSPEMVHASRTPLLIRAKTLVFVGLVGFFLMRATLLVGWGVGQKGVEAHPQLNFLLRFIPEELIYAVCVLLLAHYKDRLTRKERWFVILILGAFAVLILLTGSKAFILRIALAVFIYFLAASGDFEIPVGRAAIAAVAGLVLLVVSFSLGTAVRLGAGQSGLSPRVVQEAIYQIPRVAQPDVFFFSLGRATGRFVGFDGLIASSRPLPGTLKRVFGPTETAHRVVGQMIPFYGGRNTLSSGRAVGIFVGGHSEELHHAGAIGLFGAARVMHRLYAPIVILLIGFFWGGFFRMTELAGSFDVRFMLQYVCAYAVVRWPMAGNLDVNVSDFLIQLGQLAFYFIVLKVIFGVLKGSAARAKPALIELPR